MADPFAARRCRSRAGGGASTPPSLLPRWGPAYTRRAERGPLHDRLPHTRGWKTARRRAPRSRAVPWRPGDLVPAIHVRAGRHGRRAGRIRPDPAVLPRGDPARTGERRNRGRCPLRIPGPPFRRVGHPPRLAGRCRSRSVVLLPRRGHAAGLRSPGFRRTTAGGGRRPTTGRHWGERTRHVPPPDRGTDEGGGSGHRRHVPRRPSRPRPDGLPEYEQRRPPGRTCIVAIVAGVGRSRITDVPR